MTQKLSGVCLCVSIISVGSLNQSMKKLFNWSFTNWSFTNCKDACIRQNIFYKNSSSKWGVSIIEAYIDFPSPHDFVYIGGTYILWFIFNCCNYPMTFGHFLNWRLGSTPHIHVLYSTFQWKSLQWTEQLISGSEIICVMTMLELNIFNLLPVTWMSMSCI